MIAPVPGNPRADCLLKVFFEDVFRPLQLRHRKAGTIRLFGESIAWFEKCLARPPRVSDLNDATIAAAVQTMAGVGLGKLRIKTLRKGLLALWRYAAECHWAGPYKRPQPPAIASYSRAWADAPPADGTLLAFYRRTFRPAMIAQELKQSSKSRYDASVARFHDFAGQAVAVGSIDRGQVNEFGLWLVQHGTAVKTARQYVDALKRILRACDPDRWPAHGGRRPKATIAGETQAPIDRPRRRLPALVGEPGTMLHFYLTMYRPQVMLNGSESHDSKSLTFFRHLRLCFGRDLQLSELSSELLTQYLTWLKGRGRNACTQKGFRALWLMIWRFAFGSGLAPVVPPMRRFKVPREQPDAWSIEELTRIVVAAAELNRPPIGGIPAGKFWKALLLVGYWTALRRRSLFAIRPADLDLDGRWLYLPAVAVKNGRGKRFRLGADAIAALREIWDPERERLFPAHADLNNATFLSAHFRSIIGAAKVAPSRMKNGLFHKLRRTTITHTAARAGLAAAIALAGHSGPYVTERYIDPTFLTGNDATEWLPSVTT